MITTETPQKTSGGWVGNTTILLFDATTPTLQQLYDEILFNRGRKVPLVAVDPSTGLVADTNLVQIRLTHFVSSLVEVHLSTGKILPCTEDTVFYVMREHLLSIPVRLMRESDLVYDSSARVVSVSYITVPTTPVYNVLTDGTRCFFVNPGVLVQDSYPG